MLLSIIMLAFIFIIGLCVGSFMNVVILRTVSEESIVFPGSKCPKCQTPLKWYHNIPVFSYLFLRGKCGFCKEKISIQYPIVELLTAVLFVALFLRFCIPFDPFFGLSAINPIPKNSIVTSIIPVTIQIIIFNATKSAESCDKTERQIFSVITIVKNGISAVKNVIVRRAVQVEAKQDKPATNKKTGIKILEKP